MSGAPRDPGAPGLAGPAAVLGGVILLVVAPIPRASDYFTALVMLEAIALAIFAAFAVHRTLADAPGWGGRVRPLVGLLLASPVAIALVQLVPLPPAWWAALPGHARYAQALDALGFAPAWRAISISPDVTGASLLAALPIAAAFLLGHVASVRQCRQLLGAVAAVTFAEVLLGLLQLSGGQFSPWYFGMLTYGSPIGTMGTRNEYANLLAMGLAAYIWLAFDQVRYSIKVPTGARWRSGRFDARHAMAAWIFGGLVLVIGILISRSRAGTLVGLSAALIAVAVVGLRVFGTSRGWRFALPAAVLLAVGAVAMVGPGIIIERLTGGQLQASANSRLELWHGTWQAALAFFPFGSGWGTYDIAYRPFQGAGIVGYPNHAHMDYLELFLEGGLLFLGVAVLAGGLLVQRGVQLARQTWRTRTLGREDMLAVLCGLGLLGFLVHAAVDFPMRAPANAILAALLAGVFLRPLPAAVDSDANARP